MMKDEEVEVLREINDRQRREEEKREATMKQNRRALMGCLIAMGAFGCFLVGTCALFLGEMNSPEMKAIEQERRRCGSELEAFLNSRYLVRRHLRSPSTAEFPSSPDDRDIHIETLECGKYRVYGWVDATNGFGAILRQRYTALLVHDAADDSWSGKVDFDEED